MDTGVKLIQFVPWSSHLHCTDGITKEKAQVRKNQCAGFTQLLSPILQGAVVKFRSWIPNTAVPRIQCSLWVSSSHELESYSPKVQTAGVYIKGGFFVIQPSLFSKNFPWAIEEELTLLNPHPYSLSRSNHFRSYNLCYCTRTNLN